MSVSFYHQYFQREILSNLTGQILELNTTLIYSSKLLVIIKVFEHTIYHIYTMLIAKVLMLHRLRNTENLTFNIVSISMTIIARCYLLSADSC